MTHEPVDVGADRDDFDVRTTHHDAAIARVRDQNGYDIGFTARCSCGWNASELRESPGSASGDLWIHITETRPTDKAN